MATDELINLKMNLPRGYASYISNVTGFTDTYVRMVINGERNNDKVIDIALTLAHFEIKKRRHIKRKFNNLQK